MHVGTEWRRARSGAIGRESWQNDSSADATPCKNSPAAPRIASALPVRSIRHMLRLQILQVPYDSGYRDRRMGRGPARFVHTGAGSRLRALGHEVDAETVEAELPFPSEIATSFAVYRQLAERVRVSVDAGRFPVVLSGNCGAALGAIGGICAPKPEEAIGVVWLDAHGDFNTPETTPSGFLDGMALAALVGRCWTGPSAAIAGFRPVAEADVVLVGARDLDAGEAALLARSRVVRVGAEPIRTDGVAAALGPALDALAARVRRAYVHIDLDVLDPALVGRANDYAVPGGLSVAEAVDVVREVAARCALAGVGLSAYDPELDVDGAVWGAGIALLEAAADAGTGAQPNAPANAPANARTGAPVGASTGQAAGPAAARSEE
jgi:arginase